MLTVAMDFLGWCPGEGLGPSRDGWSGYVKRGEGSWVRGGFLPQRGPDHGSGDVGGADDSALLGQRDGQGPDAAPEVRHCLAWGGMKEGGGRQ